MSDGKSADAQADKPAPMDLVQFAAWLWNNPQVAEMLCLMGVQAARLTFTTTDSFEFQFTPGDWLLIRVDGLPPAPELPQGLFLMGKPEDGAPGDDRLRWTGLDGWSESSG
jgi:hypothetical protein